MVGKSRPRLAPALTKASSERSDRSARDSAQQVVEGGPVEALRWARLMKHRAERALFPQTAELDDVLMSDELIAVEAGQVAPSFSQGPASHVLERLASCIGCAPFLGCLRSRIALQCPQGPLNICRDTFAFLVHRHTVRG